MRARVSKTRHKSEAECGAGADIPRTHENSVCLLCGSCVILSFGSWQRQAFTHQRPEESACLLAEGTTASVAQKQAEEVAGPPEALKC